jgi:hypothetical protein
MILACGPDKNCYSRLFVTFQQGGREAEGFKTFNVRLLNAIKELRNKGV